MTNKPISLSAFGKLIGVSCEAVRKAVMTERLVKSVVRSPSGLAKIGNVELAKREWAENTSGLQQRNKAAQSAGAKKAIAKRNGASDKSPDVSTELEPQPHGGALLRNRVDDGGEDPDLSAFDEGKLDSLEQDKVPGVGVSDRVRAFYRALREKHEYEVKRGEAVPVAQAMAVYGKVITECKTRMLSVSGKARQRIPSLTKQDAKIIDDLIRQAMKGLAEANPTEVVANDDEEDEPAQKPAKKSTRQGAD